MEITAKAYYKKFQIIIYQAKTLKIESKKKKPIIGQATKKAALRSRL